MMSLGLAILKADVGRLPPTTQPRLATEISPLPHLRQQTFVGVSVPNRGKTPEELETSPECQFLL